MNPSFDALNKSITQPNRIRSRAFPMAPAMMKANPTVVSALLRVEPQLELGGMRQQGSGS
jgi:hypothetical protein